MTQDNEDQPACFRIELRRKALEQINEMVELDGSDSIPETIKNALQHYWNHLRRQGPKTSPSNLARSRPKLRVIYCDEVP
jgi:hypothetical protein